MHLSAFSLLLAVVTVTASGKFDAIFGVDHIAVLDSNGCPTGSGQGMIGGWSSAVLTFEAEDIAQSTFALLKDEVEVEEGIELDSLVDVRCAQKQIVAGINYKFTLVVTRVDDSTSYAYRSTTYVPLPYTREAPSLTGYEDLGELL